jgi:pyridoxamine 5'-phosphate oxidase-like protein
MQPDEVAEVMADPIAQELLYSAIPARVAYLARDGSPRAIAIGFHWNGSKIILGTVPTSAKVRALQRNPQVALTIDTESQPPHVLMVRGTAAVDFVDGVFDDYLAGARKLIAPDQWEGFEAEVRRLYTQMARIEITPTWAKVLDFVTRAPSAVMELAEQAAARPRE